MKILLVQAYIGNTEFPVFPLGLSCIVASIKRQNIKIFDPNVSKKPFLEFATVLAKFKPDLVGISIRNIDSTNKRRVVFYYKYLKDMIDVIKDTIGNKGKIIVGGSGFSMFAREIMHDEPRIDYGVFGEGDVTFSELIEHLESPENVKGIFYRRNGKILYTGAREYPDLDTLTFSDRFFIDLEPYQAFPDAIGVETKRGCALSCIYCPYGFLNGKQYRLRKPELVVDEIEFLIKNRGLKHFIFIDSVFNFPLAHAEAVCKEMINRKLDIAWTAWFHDKYITAEFIQLAKNAGCNKFILSPDGFSDNILNKLGKTQSKKDILRTLSILTKVDDIEICYNFFKNPPGQSLAAFLSLVLFYFKSKFQLGNRIHFEFNSIRIEPNTELYALALKEGCIKKNDDLLYPQNYTNPNTGYIEKIFDLMLCLKGR